MRRWAVRWAFDLSFEAAGSDGLKVNTGWKQIFLYEQYWIHQTRALLRSRKRFLRPELIYTEVYDHRTRLIKQILSLSQENYGTRIISAPEVDALLGSDSIFTSNLILISSPSFVRIVWLIRYLTSTRPLDYVIPSRLLPIHIYL